MAGTERRGAGPSTEQPRHSIALSRIWAILRGEDDKLPTGSKIHQSVILPLEESIDWIKSTTMFSRVSQLTSWAKDWLPPNVESRRDLFPKELLAEWAESNGWTKA